ncbi:MAG: efflux RND transporter periplasmic adaptor subunit [Holophagales bacterium]|nr:efflux RND transporter periplasmic adaptor subunit [Holophagales bacterium]MYD23906.1 efflux RND transporter periplasmic adaptor subunit [Holophagales bacterium]MYI34555.1 efflux RND transporter periplasmic adaptor subunit [Holophagales bacterium]
MKWGDERSGRRPEAGGDVVGRLRRQRVGRPAHPEHCCSFAPRFVSVAVLLLVGCVSTPAAEEHDHSHESWTVTALGERFEVFPEIDALAEGHTAMAHTHVTRLADFAPLVQGTVEIVLVDGSGEQVFGADQAASPGVFDIELMPQRAGEADLLFRIDDGREIEEIPGGRVRVGTTDHAEGLLREPSLPAGSDGGEPVSFLKEQQWQGGFATVWVREGRLARSVAGVASFRPPAGGESTITAQVDGVVQPPAGARSWPFVGRPVERNDPLFRVVPLVASERSLATLEGELEALATELESARSRSSRLRELLALEAVSEREVEEAGVRARMLEARHRAAERDLESARASREGGADSAGISPRAPFSGRIAAVTTTPGATVSAGDALARLVRTDVVWIEVALPPQDARRLMDAGLRGLVLDDPESGPVRVEGDLSLVSISPELSPRTGTVTVLIEAPGIAGTGFALGSTVAAQVLMAGEESGIVVPASALVDDGGVPVVFLQLSGEDFQRQTVTVLGRQGDQVLLAGLAPGQRLVTRGGDAIRRSSLMASGEAHGHVH